MERIEQVRQALDQARKVLRVCAAYIDQPVTKGVAENTAAKIDAALSALEAEGGTGAEASTLRARIAELEGNVERAGEVIAPFAKEAEQWVRYFDEEMLVEGWKGGPISGLSVAHLRAARRYVEEGK